MTPKIKDGPALNKQTGYYYFSARIGFPPDRKQYRYSLHTKDLAKAQFLWEQEYKRHWAKHYGLRTHLQTEKLFIPLAREYVTYCRNVKRTKEWRTTEGRLDIIGRLWGDIPINSIGTDHFAQLDLWLREHSRTHSTINHYFAILKTFFNWCIDREYYIGKNPIKSIRPYAVDGKRRAYTAEEIGRILDAAERVEREAHGGALIQRHAKRIVLLCLYTGMRLGEVLNLRWENINAEKIILKRTETKSRKEKVIPLTDGLRDVLDSLKDGRIKTGYVLPLRRRSGRMKASWAGSVIRKIRKYSGVSDFVFHSLRHTAASIMVREGTRAGAGLHDIKMVLGHSSITTTERYLHPTFNGMRRAVSAVEAVAKKPASRKA